MCDLKLHMSHLKNSNQVSIFEFCGSDRTGSQYTQQVAFFGGTHRCRDGVPTLRNPLAISATSVAPCFSNTPRAWNTSDFASSNMRCQCQNIACSSDARLRRHWLLSACDLARPMRVCASPNQPCSENSCARERWIQNRRPCQPGGDAIPRATSRW